MDDHRHLFFPCEFKLAYKPFLLYIMALVIPVIIQPDLAYCHDLLQIQELLHLRHMIFRKRTHFVRMDADRSIYKRIVVCQFTNLPP